jgi:hypothetical protein
MAGGEENYTKKSPHWVRISLKHYGNKFKGLDALSVLKLCHQNSCEFAKMWNGGLAKLANTHQCTIH